MTEQEQINYLVRRRDGLRATACTLGRQNAARLRAEARKLHRRIYRKRKELALTLASSQDRA